MARILSYPTTKIVRSRKRSPSRRPPTTNLQAFRRHASRVGMAVLAWNDLHANLYIIFWYLIGLSNPENLSSSRQAAYGIWHTIQSDKTQRDMIREAASANLVGSKDLLSRLTWILDQANQLSTYRNLAAHTSVIFHSLSGDNPRADRWSTRATYWERHRVIDHSRFWRLLAGDLSALSRYTGRLADDLWRPGKHATSLQKPKLQSVPLIRQIEDQLNRARQAAARSRLPPTSQQRASKGVKRKKKPLGP